MSDILSSKLLKLTASSDMISLYIHIPFCSTKCDYCAFYSESQSHWNKDDIVERYLDRLNKEISAVKISLKNKPFESVFIGGGNPGSLSINQLRSLLINIGPSLETTFEINPESFIEDFDGYKKIFSDGLATRLSMGIQSMDDSVLNILNRNASKDDNLKALSFANELSSIKIDRDFNYFINNNLYSNSLVPVIDRIEISLDLMTCLPTQTLEMAKNDIEAVTRIANPNHLSLYCLTVEEGTKLKDRVGLGDVKVMNEDEQTEHLNALWSYLKQSGYDHYEVSNFSKNGKECAHNNKYWTLKSYIGLGSHSASTLYDGNELVRLYNDSTFNEFIKGDVFSGYQEEIIDIPIQRDEYLLVALRTSKGISIDILNQKYNIEEDVLNKSLASVDSSLYNQNEHFVWLNEQGFMLLDSIVLSLSLGLDNQTGYINK
jgi:oxygen-independent coproporphyrinogen-3 oxidase